MSEAEKKQESVQEQADEQDRKTKDGQEEGTEDGKETKGKKPSRMSKALIAAAAALFSGAGATVVGILVQAAVDRIPGPSTPPPDPGAVVSETGKLSMSRNSFLRAIEDASGEECVYDYYGFFDDDADCEMYALVGTTAGEEEGGALKARLWFANTDGAQEVISEELNYNPDPYVVTLKGRQFLVLQQWDYPDTLTYLWGVYEGQPYETNLSCRGTEFRVNTAYDELELITYPDDAVQAYMDDSESIPTGTGRTVYYFDYDSMNFKEYGGIPISMEDLKQLNGGEELVDAVNQVCMDLSASVSSVFYRDNGIINVSIDSIDSAFGEDDEELEGAVIHRMFGLSLRYRNEELRIIPWNDNEHEIKWDKKQFLENLDDFLEEGYYLKALCPDIAVYPTSFPQ